MSFVQFLIHGVDHFPDATRDHHPKDSTIEKYAKIDTFEGKITGIFQSDVSKTIHIDHAYKVSMISDKIRETCSELWTRLKNGTMITFMATLIGSASGIAAAWALGIIFPDYIIAAVVIGVVALGIFGLSLVAMYRSHQAAEQLTLWEDPTDDYIKACKKHHLQQKVKEANDELETQKADLSLQHQKYKAELETKVKDFVELKKKNDASNPKPSSLVAFFDKRIEKVSAQIAQIKKWISESEANLITETDDKKIQEIKDAISKANATKAKFEQIIEKALKSKEERLDKDIASHKEHIKTHCDFLENSLISAVNLYVILGTVPIETAYSILEPYFSELALKAYADSKLIH